MGQSGTAEPTRSNVACVTGHRPIKLGGYDFNNPIRTTARVLTQEIIEEWYGDGIDTYITGMAQGYDQDAAHAVIIARAMLKLPLRLHAYLPCLNQDSMWPPQAKQQYIWLLSQCDEVRQITNKPYERSCMQKRNVAMVDDSSRVIACWNLEKKGGTWNCIEYAQSQGVPVTILGVKK